MSRRRPAPRAALVLLLLGAEAGAFERSEPRAPCADHAPLRQPFFGDSHVHTALSMDAWGQGTLARPGDAYRFARGERIGIQPYDAAGQPLASIQLRRPLDWAAVTDHSDLLGETRICGTPGLPGHDSLVCRVVRRWPGLGYALVNGHVYSSESPRRYSFCGEAGASCIAEARGPWREIQEAAEAHYDRSEACRFTTFVGYEWTAMPGGRNLHRNVIFRNEVAQALPTTYIETPTPEGLHRALLRECLEADPRCDVVAIPHNSNVSGGRMFAAARGDGSPLTPDDARLRARLETLVEVIQHKGGSECDPDGDDELCRFEMLPFDVMADMAQPRTWGGPLPDGSTAREALAEGLVLEAALGTNPFRFGLIGSTDTHFAAPGMVDEDQYRGHAAGLVSARFGIPEFSDLPVFNPGGLAVLWAEENSRDALFEAMKRREAYGTSGPRILVRLFAGFDLAEDLCEDGRFAERGYAGGVPMGGVLAPPPHGAARLRVAVRAARDPGGDGAPATPLERIQIVKGWLEAGRPRLRVADVAGSRGAGASLDLARCAPRGPHAELCAVWEDPAFEPAQPAFYYARVLENPSCRWNQYVCSRRGVDCARPQEVPPGFEACCDPAVPRTIQERAWTSPVWVAARADAASASPP